MFKDIKAFENYVRENFEKHVMLTQEHIDFVNSKLTNIRTEFERLEKETNDTRTKCDQKIGDMQQRVTRAEEREKAQIERQKEFGSSQTKVEESRHKNIMVELQFLKDSGIVVFNRSSYPFYPRYSKPFKKGKKDEKKKEEVKKSG